MYFGSIKNCDIANGPGVRVSLFVSGCTNHCEGCFQPETWDFSYGEPFTRETEERVLALLSPSYIAGLSVLGGEPFEPDNQRALVPFLRRVRERFPEKTIWCYSGFTYEELTGKKQTTRAIPAAEHAARRDDARSPRCEATDAMLSMLNVLVDGRYVAALRDISLRFRGSRNQRVIDLDAVRRTGEIALLY